MGQSLPVEAHEQVLLSAPAAVDPISQRVASNLLRLRSKRNLSLDGLARLSGVSRAYTLRVEK